MWLTVLDENDEQAVDKEGRPKWICRTGAHRINTPEPVVRCPCQAAPCAHLGQKIGEVKCGCGGGNGRLAVHECAKLGPATEFATGTPQRFRGRRLAVCLGCGEYEARQSAGTPPPDASDAEKCVEAMPHR